MTLDAGPDGMLQPDRLTLLKDQSLTTPAGIEARAPLTRRRYLVLALNLSTWFFIVCATALLLSYSGWTVATVLMVLSVALGAPWPVLGFWNAVIGLWQLHGKTASGTRAISATLAADASAIRVNTAVLMTLRNEDPARALHRLKIVKESLDRTSEGARFSYFVLSDSDRAGIIRQEEACVEAWRAADPDSDRIFYRRRSDNHGFKAGNIRDFALRWGADFELMLVLDADSLMSGEAIAGLVRVMQKYPRLGILQSLVVGTPSSSAFARLFQFGMRLGMRTYTMGQAWWVGDCGPFWGHNAVVRIKPYVESCNIEGLLGERQILSHDQIEAVLMRRAGFEVRVLPFETGSYEDNPPDLLTFMQRDVRWCQGNLQYVSLLGMRGIEPVSRFQLIWAILMFLGVPAWTLFAALSPFVLARAQNVAGFPWHYGEILFGAVLAFHLAPKLAGLADAVMTPGEVWRFGGASRFALSAIAEIVFSLLLAPVTAIRTTIFMTALASGKSITWGAQERDGTGLSWRAASQALWPQALFGLALYVSLAAISPALLLWSFPLTAGYLLAIPFAVVTASPGVGEGLRHLGIAGIPEDFAPTAEITAIGLGR